MIRYGRPLRFLLKMLPEDEPLPILSGPLRGYRWIPASSVKSCWLGIYESAKLRQICEHVRPGGVFYDIGAQAGYHALLAARLVGPEGRVYAFEPLPRNLEYLSRHLTVNGISNVEIVRAAVSSEGGECAFDPGPGFMAGHLSAAGTLRVPAVSMDSWIWSAQHPLPPSVLKIDVDGAELKVLQGAVRTIRQARPAILLDTHDFLGDAHLGLHDACRSFLEAEGYLLRSEISKAKNEASTILALPQ